MNRKVLVAGLLVALPLVGLLLMGLSRDPSFIASPLVGRAAPAFHLVPLEGGAPVTLESLRGRPVVLNFWATWCVPCADEHPVLVEAARRHAGNVAFLGVVYGDSAANVSEFIRRNGAPYPIVLDEGGRAAIAYGVYGVPETFFLDGRGVIVEKQVGPLSSTVLEARLAQATASGGPAQ